MIANSEFREGKIVQDRLTIIDGVLQDPNRFGYSDQKSVIDAVIDFRIECWKHGFSEKTYNFTINYGSYEDGTISLIDLGELSDSKKEIKKAIENKRWLSQWSYFYHMNEGVKDYYRKEMDRRITKEKLEEVFPE